jgi:hypothetical protein
MDHIVREAIEIELHRYNINREGSFCLVKSWKPFIDALKLSGHDPGTLGDAVPRVNNLNPKELCLLGCYPVWLL